MRGPHVLGGGVLVCAGFPGPGVGSVLVCVGSESSRELALTRRGTARLCPGASVCAVGLCVAPVSMRMPVHQAWWPRPQGESCLHVHLQVLLWVSCESGHLAGKLVSGHSAGASPVDIAPKTQRPLGVSAALVASEVPTCPSPEVRPGLLGAGFTLQPVAVHTPSGRLGRRVCCPCHTSTGPRVPGSADPWRLGRALTRPRRWNQNAAVGSAAGVRRGARPGVLTGGRGCGDLSRSGVAVGVASDYVSPRPRFPAATPLLRRPQAAGRVTPGGSQRATGFRVVGRAHCACFYSALPATAGGRGTHRPSRRGPGLSWGWGHRRVGALCCLSAHSQPPALPQIDDGGLSGGPACLSKGRWDEVAQRPRLHLSDGLCLQPAQDQAGEQAQRDAPDVGRQHRFPEQTSRSCLGASSWADGDSDASALPPWPAFSP